MESYKIRRARRNSLAVASGAMALAQGLAAARATDIKAEIEDGDARGAYDSRSSIPASGAIAFDFYFGVAAIDSGNAGEGVLALELTLVTFPDNRQARLELARGYFILGKIPARAKNSTCSEDQPAAGSDSQRRALPRRAAGRESQYRTTAGAFVEFGVGYDTNINGGVSNATSPCPVSGPVTTRWRCQSRRGRSHSWLAARTLSIDRSGHLLFGLAQRRLQGA